mmetsp:Transcript_50105/g.162197  ORF Transcript_50105/g.162197 Transcript_50105/m.162197 type:complete len:339 (+) Transcript_50105:1705-2721(+)
MLLLASRGAAVLPVAGPRRHESEALGAAEPPHTPQEPRHPLPAFVTEACRQSLGNGCGGGAATGSGGRTGCGGAREPGKAGGRRGLLHEQGAAGRVEIDTLRLAVKPLTTSVPPPTIAGVRAVAAQLECRRQQTLLRNLSFAAALRFLRFWSRSFNLNLHEGQWSLEQVTDHAHPLEASPPTHSDQFVAHVQGPVSERNLLLVPHPRGSASDDPLEYPPLLGKCRPRPRESPHLLDAVAPELHLEGLSVELVYRLQPRLVDPYEVGTPPKHVLSCCAIGTCSLEGRGNRGGDFGDAQHAVREDGLSQLLREEVGPFSDLVEHPPRHGRRDAPLEAGVP